LSTSPSTTTPIFVPSAGAIDAIVEAVDDEHGVLLSASAAAAASSRKRLMVLPRGEALKVEWEGLDIKMVMSVAIGDRLSVWPSLPSSRGRAFWPPSPAAKSTQRQRPPQKYERVTLEAKRPWTLGREAQKRAIVAAAADDDDDESLAGARCARATVVKAIPSGVLVRLDGLDIGGLVGRIDRATWDVACSADPKPGDVLTVPVWVTATIASSGRIVASLRDPSKDPHRRDPSALLERSSLPIAGEVLRIVPSLPGRAKLEEHALVTVAKDTIGALSLSSVRGAVAELHRRHAQKNENGGGASSSGNAPPRRVWELADVLKIGDDVTVLVRDNRGAGVAAAAAAAAGTCDDPLNLDIALPSAATEEQSITTTTTTGPTTGHVAKTRGEKLRLLDLDDYVLLGVLGFLGRSDLATLYGNINNNNKAPASAVRVHSRLAILADRATAHRYATENLCCAYTREHFRSPGVLLGLGIRTTTHGQRHSSSAQKSGTAASSARPLLSSAARPSGVGGAAPPQAPMLSEWFGADDDGPSPVVRAAGVLARAAEWAQQQEKENDATPGAANNNVAAAQQTTTTMMKTKKSSSSTQFALSDEAEERQQRAQQRRRRSGGDGKGDLDTVSPCFGSLLSLRAHVNFGVRRTPWRVSFGHVLPVWLDRFHGGRAAPVALRRAAMLVMGEEGAFACFEQLSQDLRTSSSSPSSSSEPPFSAMLPPGLEEADASPAQMDLLLAFATFCTKAMNSTVVEMMQGDLHESVAALEGYFLLYQLLLNVALRYPALLSTLSRRVRRFCFGGGGGGGFGGGGGGGRATKCDLLEQCRGKAAVPSLGELLPLLPLAGVPWSDAVEPVVDEAFVRNARWAVQKHPELAEIERDESEPRAAVGKAMGEAVGEAVSAATKNRLEKTFGANLVSLRLLSFHCVAADLVLTDAGGGAVAQAKSLEATLGAPSSAAVARLQAAAASLKRLGSWRSFFEDGVRLRPPPTPRYLGRWLRRTLDLSNDRGYHSQCRALRALRDSRRAEQEQRRRSAFERELEGRGGWDADLESIAEATEQRFR
jgi:hypothetical protein